MSNGKRADDGEEHSGEVVMYRSDEGRVELDVRFDGETVWLSLQQMATLFERNKSVISRHLKNVFDSGELPPTVAKKATVQLERGREVTRKIEYFNLDAVIAVGYRVNSKRGTQFRIWATRTLRDHLICGYTLNERRLRERGVDIQQAVSLLSQTLATHAMVTAEGKAVLDVVSRYTRTWQLLPQYDNGELAEAPHQPVKPSAHLNVEAAREIIARLRATLAATGEPVELFGRERTEHLEGILAAIEQTFDQRPLYPSAQGRAAHLFYFVVKDHPFADGNKRIGALLFLEYLQRNNLLLGSDGRPRLADNAVVALALLVAESNPRNKDLMIRLIVNLLDEQFADEVQEAIGAGAGSRHSARLACRLTPPPHANKVDRSAAA